MRSTSNSGVQGFNALRIIAVLLLMICGGLSVQGQTVFGRISGAVKDPNGGGRLTCLRALTQLRLSARALRRLSKPASPW